MGFRLLGSAGVKFNAPFLSNLLDLFGRFPDHCFVKEILVSLRDIMCRLAPEDYALIFRIMMEHKMFAE